MLLLVLPGPYLLLGGPPPALAELAVVVHGGGAAAGRLAALATLGVQHPPGALARALVLHPHEAAVQGQVVSDGVLQAGREGDVLLRLITFLFILSAWDILGFRLLAYCLFICTFFYLVF